MNHFLVAVEAQIVAIGGDVRLRHAEALRGARAFALRLLPLLPARQHVGQVVPGVFLPGERLGRDGAELILGQERLAFVVQAPAVGVHVVEPDVVRAAGVGFGEEQDSRGDTGVGLERPARK